MNIYIKTSSNLYFYWNIGSILMINMMIQILIGFMLSMHYFFFSNNLFLNSFYIFFNLNYGWMTRFFHSNMTSLIFIMMFFHMNRNMMYKNYLLNKNMWISGLSMLIMLMMIAFLGYSLINSQMSYWASMVITNFISIIPLIGNKMMLMIWGNQFINNILLNRFFSFHFIFSLLILLMSMIHLIILHMKKSSNPLNLNNNIDQINLNSLLIFKDLIFMLMIINLFLILNMIIPIKLNNKDNFNAMMIFKTPNHIEPEWYFLFFYSIIRSNKNKLNGLITMIFSIIIWFLIPNFNKTKFLSNKFLLMNKIILINLNMMLILTSFLGTKTSKEPYIMFMKIFIIMYFKYFMLMMMMTKILNKI